MSYVLGWMDAGELLDILDRITRQAPTIIDFDQEEAMSGTDEPQVDVPTEEAPPAEEAPAEAPPEGEGEEPPTQG